MKAVYAAVLTPVCDSSGYVARVPDVNGCITTGNDLQDALENIRDALAASLCTLEDLFQPIPMPSTAETVQRDSDSIITMVDVDTAKYRKETEIRNRTEG